MANYSDIDLDEDILLQADDYPHPSPGLDADMPSTSPIPPSKRTWLPPHHLMERQGENFYGRMCQPGAICPLPLTDMSNKRNITCRRSKKGSSAMAMTQSYNW